MSCLKIIGAVYQKFEHPFTPIQLSVKESMLILMGKLIEQIRLVGQLLPESEREQITEQYLCSTIINHCFSTGDIAWSDCEDLFKNELSDLPPPTFISVYECASWGYALRYFFKKRPDANYFMVTIADANIYDFEYYTNNEDWGQAGFGSTTLLIKKSGDLKDELLNGFGGQSKNPMLEFAISIRKKMMNKKDGIAALPFFSDNVRKTLETSLKGFNILPNGYKEWGHCFGSDPWLSIITNHKLSSSEKKEINYLACSYSLSGYYSSAEINVTPESVLRILK